MVNYTKNNEKVKIICPEHGVFEQVADKHLNSGCGCMRCGGRTNLSTEEYVSRCVEKHGNKYDYSKTKYVNSNTKVEIVCPNHGSFWQLPFNHSRKGYNCPSCGSSQSNPSDGWLDSLNNPNIIREYRLPENRLMPVDGYDPTTNTIYQFHGSYWHSDPRAFSPNKMHVHKNVLHRENYIKSNIKDFQLLCWGYKLVIMWEYDWDILNKSKI